MKQLLVGLLLMLGTISLGANSPSPLIQEIDRLRFDLKEDSNNSPGSSLSHLFQYQKIHKKILASTPGGYPLSAQYQFYFKEALPHLDQLLSAIRTKPERRHFLKIEAPIMENALHVCYQLYRENKDQKYLEEAFDLIEKQKFPSRQLPNTIPSKLSDSYRYLTGQIHALEDSIQQIDLPEMRKRKNDLYQELSIVHQQIKKDHPEYAAFLGLHQMVSLKNFQKLLANDEAVLQYFLGEQTVYALVIRANQFEFKATPIPKQTDIKKQLARYLQGLKEPGRYHTMVPTAHHLYELLLQAVEEDLQGVERITIIPDLALQTIPFEALLKSLPEKLNSDYAKLDYLILHYQFAYNRSSTQMAQHLRSYSVLDKAPLIVAFAPGFDQDLHQHFSSFSTYQKDTAYLQLDSLSHLTKNLDWLNTNLGAKTYKWEEATISNFNEHRQADILHLGTHIIFNPDYPMQSKIVLAKEVHPKGHLSNAYLSLKDLHALHLNMDFAVLAGCISGKDGFGFAYAFESAGISSTLYSLWKINEKESAEIIQLFYQHLKNGSPTARALHLAKKDYLQNSKDLKLAPKFWAAFVFNGDSQGFAFKQTPPKRSSILWVSIGACFLLGLFWYSRKKLKSLN